jgi:hypothetical protein
MHTGSSLWVHVRPPCPTPLGQTIVTLVAARPKIPLALRELVVELFATAVEPRLAVSLHLVQAVKKKEEKKLE